MSTRKLCVGWLLGSVVALALGFPWLRHNAVGVPKYELLVALAASFWLLPTRMALDVLSRPRGGFR